MSRHAPRRPRAGRRIGLLSYVFIAVDSSTYRAGLLTEES